MQARQVVQEQILQGYTQVNIFYAYLKIKNFLSKYPLTLIQVQLNAKSFYQNFTILYRIYSEI